MTKDDFWDHIDKSRKVAEDTEEQMGRLLGAISSLEPAEILDFDRHFRECVRDAYRHDLWAVAYIVNGGCSDDGFDYFLGWLIAQGRKYFEAALVDPQAAAKNAVRGEENECENLWYIASGAYETKTGKADFYDIAPRVPRTIQGDEWHEDSVDELFPALAKKFFA